MSAKRKHPLRDRASRAFTLIEVMIASVVFLIAVGGTFSALKTGARQFANQRYLTTALQIAESSTEELLLRFQSADDLDPGSHSKQFDAAGNVSATAVASGYTLTWVVTPSNPIAALRRIDVTVTWTRDRVPHRIALFTYRP